ncbi:MAG: hypothetical protein WAW20_15435, partial [Anaerolineae bacterium]
PTRTPTRTPTSTATRVPLVEPVLLEPEDGESTSALTDPPTGSPTLRWASQAVATRYYVQLSNSSGFAVILEEADTLSTAWTPTKSLGDGIIYWRVKAGNTLGWGPYSSPRFFSKDWSAGGVVVAQPLAPADGATLAAFSAPVFSWSEVPGAARYLFQVDGDLNFGSVDYSALTLKAAHTPTVRLASGLYYWRVTPIDNREHYGAPSPLVSFRLEWNETPRLLAPADNPYPPLTFSPEFRWTAVAGAREYRLEVSTSPDFTTVTIYTTRSAAFTPDRNLANDQEYYWRVRAVDAQFNTGPWSEVRRFQMRWNLAPRLLTPLNNQIALGHPVFSWMPVAGAEKYQIQVDESIGFAAPIKFDERIYGAVYAHTGWGEIILNATYYWRVRAIDARGNLSPWSEVRGFDFGARFGPNLIFPPHYAESDTNLAVTADATQATPLFIWDTVHDAGGARPYQAADRYTLEVRDALDGTLAFSLTTAGHAAAPTTNNPFSGLLNGRLYSWTVTAYVGSTRLGFPMTSLARLDSARQTLPAAAPLQLLFPDDGREATVDAPILGWQPAPAATSYRVQIAEDRDFSRLVDEASAQFLNYIPWQGRQARLPNGAYFWRVRPEPGGDWSEVRHFNISHRLLTGNRFDYPLPQPLVGSELNQVASGSSQELKGLFVAQDRYVDASRLSWVIALDTQSYGALQFGIYFDTNHCNDPDTAVCRGGAGATSDPLGKAISTDGLYRPEYVLYAQRNGGLANADSTYLYTWNGSGWGAAQSLASIGGAVADTGEDIEIRLPYVALGSGDANWIGSLALAAFTSAADSAIRQALPAATGNTLTRFAFTSDALNPIYPFDSPGEGLLAQVAMPGLRWLMPAYDSVDGYQVEVARDPGFTDVVETWETWESNFTPNPLYMFLATSFTTKQVYANNQSYYWRVRVRHELILPPPSTLFDYGPWSQPSRFTLDSLPTGGLTSAPTFTTPTFSWQRVEGASGYTLQVDDNNDFS